MKPIIVTFGPVQTDRQTGRKRQKATESCAICTAGLKDNFTSEKWTIQRGQLSFHVPKKRSCLNDKCHSSSDQMYPSDTK